ncbi:MAG: YveK family protein [Bilifractor sp.]
MEERNKLAVQTGKAPASPDDDGVTIDLADVFKAIGANIGQILIVALVFAIVACAITIFVIKPTYRSYFTAFVNNRTTASEDTQSLQSGDVSAAQSLTYTYAAIMKSRPVIEDALKKASLDSEYEYKDISDNITTEIEQNTQLVTVYVVTGSAEDSYNLAKAIAEIAPDYIASVVEGSSMKVVTNPVMPTQPYSPSVKKNVAIGFLVGMLLMMVITVVRSLGDTRIKDAQQLEGDFDIPIIGTIPNYEQAASGHSGSSRYYYRKQNRKGED